MLKLTFDYNAEYNGRNVKYYIDKSCTHDNPTVLLKYFHNGILQRVVVYNEESEVLYNFSYNTKSFVMMTDSVSGKWMKSLDIYKFMGIELDETVEEEIEE